MLQRSYHCILHLWVLNSLDYKPEDTSLHLIDQIIVVAVTMSDSAESTLFFNHSYQHWLIFQQLSNIMKDLDFLKHLFQLYSISNFKV